MCCFVVDLVAVIFSLSMQQHNTAIYYVMLVLFTVIIIVVQCFVICLAVITIRGAAVTNRSPLPQTIRRSSKPITSRRNRKHLSPKPFAFPPNDRQIGECARSHNEEKRGEENHVRSPAEARTTLVRPAGRRRPAQNDTTRGHWGDQPVRI